MIEKELTILIFVESPVSEEFKARFDRTTTTSVGVLANSNFKNHFLIDHKGDKECVKG